MHRYFFFLLLLILPTQLGYHFWPEWARVLGRPVDYLSPTIFLTDILLILTVGSWAIEKFSKSNFQFSIKRKSFETRKIFLWILVAGFIAANIFFAASPFVALYKWIKVFEFFLLGYYIVKTKPSLSLVTSALSLAALYSSLIAIGQFVLQHSIGGPLWFLGERTFRLDTPGIARVSLCQVSGVTCQELLRSYATFPHPNVLGGFLASVLPLVVVQMGPIGRIRRMGQIWSQGKNQLFYLTVFVVGFAGLLVTFSRSAIVVAVLATTAMLVNVHGFRIKSGMTKTFLFAGMTAVLLAILFFLLPFSAGDESVVVRRQLNAVAIQQWWSSPVYGVGLGNFLVNLPTTIPTRAIYFLQPVHNIYLLLLSEVGVVGIVVVAWVLIKMVTSYKRQETRKNQFNDLPVSWHLPLVVLLLLGLIDHYPLTLQQGQLLLTVLVCMSIITRNTR